ncbi:PKD domain-containing protein, partial [Candidatus Woesearchaeota archaeon]|nr:PKD domain-containing protein [Candidatus Woesearchaeota archaeon]
MLHYLKRGIVLVFLLLFLQTALAGFTINLTRESVGPDQPFDGYIELNYTTTLPSDAVFNFTAANSSFLVSLRDLLKNNWNVKTIPSFYKKGSSSASASYVFNRPGTVLAGALDLSENGANKPQDVLDVQKATFTIEGTTAQGIYPSDVRLFVGNSLFYTYKGQFLEPAQYAPFNSSYVNGSASGSKNMRGGKNDVFCEQVQLQPSEEYQIRVTLSGIDDASQTINATISDIPVLDCTQTSCCQLHPSLSQLEPTCVLKKDVQSTQLSYLCVSVEGGESDKTYYRLATDNDPRVVSGYYNGQAVNLDYHIFGAWRTYERRLLSSKTINASTDVLNIYKEKSLLLPLNISSSTNGIVRLSNLSLEFNTNTGVSTLSSFTSLDFFPEQVNLTSVIRIPFSSLSFLKSPSDYGSYLPFFVQFMNSRSDKLYFHVIPAPVPVIRMSTTTPNVNDIVRFDGSQSYSPQNRVLVRYYWDFGDGSNATGMNTTHAYTQTKNFTGILTVYDEKNIAGTRSFTITLAGSTLNIGEQLTQLDNTTASTLQLFSSPSLKTLSQDLHLPQQVQALQANISSLKKEYITIDLNNTLNDTERDILFQGIRGRLHLVSASLPVQVRIDQSVTFNPKISSLDEIPSSLNTGNFEQFEEKVFKAQQSVSVTGEARVVSIRYADQHTTSFVLVKKTISGSGKYYDLFPASISSKQYLSEAPEETGSTVSFSSSPFIYLLDGQTPLSQVKNIKTIVLPGVLPDLDTGDNNVAVCGNNKCELGETSSSCANDCGSQPPYLALSILVIVLILGLVYIFLYKGKYNFHNLFGKKMKKNAKELFPHEKEYLAVKKYVEQALQKQFLPSQILEALK